MHYEIRHGHKTGRQLTTAQRTSGTFSEEPIVLGKVMRRGSRPVRLTAEQFEQHKAKLLRQLMAGSIEIFRVDENKDPVRCEYRALRGLSSPDDAPAPSTGDQVAQPGGAGPAPAAPPKQEETEAATQPPSSAPSGTPEPEAGAEGAGEGEDTEEEAS